ncbi:glucosamine-6-phosphate deaminase [Arsenicitalea aurantiaca]|uniref:Glucosamine-6-phosphate deaminase n=1 Tax=Arsenicitalea aurantiaca TaxID=1783274 RepID=A0A433XKZ0_9HYPH|nr:glucosamine-6-phosphate deaminase [Arsenicitalea aurantiaca]RUT34745.1 glucosamine-6-phosphate deaminase [Arsenicitalea aurantiaca]
MNEPFRDVRVCADAVAAEALAAGLVADQVARRPHSVLGLATGRTMIGVYEALIERAHAEGLSFAEVESFNLDEYCGLGPEDAASFARYMERHLFSRLDFDKARCHLPDGLAADGAPRYEALIRRAGGIDLQLLGIGRNGHIGFNEPGSARGSRTRVVELSEETREANRPDFPAGHEVPGTAITMGVATILEARRIVLVATGAAKAEALAGALEGEVGEHNPASFLQGHRHVTIVCDREAAAGLGAAAHKETHIG